MATWRELKQAVGERYRAAGSWERRQIRDEFTRVTGYRSKHSTCCSKESLMFAILPYIWRDMLASRSPERWLLKGHLAVARSEARHYRVKAVEYGELIERLKEGRGGFGPWKFRMLSTLWYLEF